MPFPPPIQPLAPFSLSLTPKHRIVIMGVSGAGKTTVGMALAQALGILFRDGDDLHPAANVEKMRAGHPLTDEDRWGWLELVANSLRRDAPIVMACSALRHVYRDHIRAGAGGAVRFVHLTGSKDLIAQRMATRAHKFMTPALLDSQFQALEPPSAEEAMILPITLPLAQQVAMITAMLAEAATSSALPPAAT